MCGICGIVSQAPITDTSPVKLMQQAMYHRGPDGEGEFYDKHIAMAMRRLSIIDLKSGWQPLYNEDSSLVLIANGEIYNFIELREMLQSKGHRFKTGSDCEVIVHLFEEYGIECVNHLRGMFTFALWDSKKQQLILARDRLGEKPLYIYEYNNQLIFSSEIKSLLSSKCIPFILNPGSINLYFYYQYVPEPYTPIDNVIKLEAAHLLIVDVRSWQIRKIGYWDMNKAPALKGNPAQLIRNKLEEISEIIIRSDVPVGVALSGGLDSSAITAIISRKYKDKIHAFSAGYPDKPANDERDEAKAFADYLDIPFHDVELSTKDMISFFPELVFWRDDPIADISGYCYYSVMQLAKKHRVPVILQGQGGDELFWGYPWVKQSVQESIRKLSKPNNISAVLDYLRPEPPKTISMQGMVNWIKSVGGILNNLNRYHYYKNSPKNRLVFYDLSPDFKNADKDVGCLYTKEFSEHANSIDPYDIFTISDREQKIDILITRLICQTYLLENGIAQGDRLSMASSVELRLPLLDYQLVETVIGIRKLIPDYMLQPKALFKEALKDIVPEWVIKRPKRGFAPPSHEWYNALLDTYGSSLNDGYLIQTNVLKTDSARTLSSKIYPPGVITPLSFKALVLDQWCNKMSELCKE